MNRKVIALLLCVFLLTLAGCSKSLREHTQTLPNSIVETESTQPSQTLPPETAAQPSPLPAETAPPATQTAEPPVVTEPVPVVISSAFALRDYLRIQEEAGHTDFSFYFSPTTVDVSARNIARVGGYFYVQTQVDGNFCTVYVLDFPGERMVDAWRSGDTSQLTQDESQALQIALNLVTQARENTATELELEQRLFDLFRDHVSYNDGSTDIPDPLSPPRHLTAVGALVDGSANCQGYADGFYVLATLAGFRVERMHVDIPEGGHTVNVIYLDGAWYVVDTTYNDLDDPSGAQISYALMNVGKDKCLRYSWHESMERYPIASQTDHHFYYNQERRCFDSVQAMAQWVVDDWRAYGTTEYYLMLERNMATWQDLGNALEEIAAGYGLKIPYTIWHEHHVEDTYFHIQLG